MSQLLDSLLNGYDKRLRPNYKGQRDTANELIYKNKLCVCACVRVCVSVRVCVR